MTDRAAGVRPLSPYASGLPIRRSPAGPPAPPPGRVPAVPRTPAPGERVPVPLPEALTGAVDVLRGMAYEHRLHILVLLMEGESTPDALAAAMSLEGTVVSHHLRNLRDTSLIRRQRRGRNVYYSLSGEPARRLVAEVLRYAEK